jgi:hypothetical protein
MKTETRPVIVCPQPESHNGIQAAVCAIVLEAPTLLALSTSVTNWVNAHPQYRLLTFSHALETRLEPGANLAGPRPYSVYTGVLLVSPPARMQAEAPLDVLAQGEQPLARHESSAN